MSDEILKLRAQVEALTQKNAALVFRLAELETAAVGGAFEAPQTRSFKSEQDVLKETRAEMKLRALNAVVKQAEAHANAMIAENDQLRARIAELENALAVGLAEATMHIAEGSAAYAHEQGQIASFVDKVRQMRALQVEYFRTRDKTTLVASKRIEAEIDNTIKNNILFIELLKRVPKELKF